MSEALPGVPPPPPPAAPKDAAAVVLFRRAADGGGVEVFWLKRDPGLRVAGGFYAFPGGKLDPSDAEVPVHGATGHDAQLAAAARELFEETGVLLARGTERLTTGERDAFRRQLLDEQTSFHDGLSRHALTIHAADFVPAGRWVTPEFMPVGRFDARFSLVEVGPDTHAEVWPGELSEGAWVRPADALTQWEAGRALLHPPNLHVLQVMNAFTDVASALDALRAPPDTERFISHRLEFQRGIRLVPLVTPTLPPATHTNTYLLGTHEFVVVDPGSPDDEQLETLFRRVEALVQSGAVFKAIVLTHHHFDHVAGVPRLAQRFGVPVWAHPRTADRVPVPVERLLVEGDVIELDGPLPMTWQVLATPGHARGHVTLVDRRSRAAVVGDMVSGVGTIVIDPPEGDMAEYLRQLERLKAHVGTIYPAHGPAIPDGVAKLDEYLRHRAWREAKVYQALASFSEPVTLGDLVTRAYDDVASFVWPIAERNTAAIVEKLVAEGRAEAQGLTFRALP